MRITAGWMLCQLLDSDFFPNLAERLPHLALADGSVPTVEEAIAELLELSDEAVLTPHIMFKTWE